MKAESKQERILRKDLKAAGYPAVRRLAKFLCLKHLDTMSDKQVLCLVWWRLSRAEKRERGFILGY